MSGALELLVHPYCGMALLDDNYFSVKCISPVSASGYPHHQCLEPVVVYGQCLPYTLPRFYMDSYDRRIRIPSLGWRAPLPLTNRSQSCLLTPPRLVEYVSCTVF